MQNRDKNHIELYNNKLCDYQIVCEEELEQIAELFREEFRRYTNCDLSIDEDSTERNIRLILKPGRSDRDAFELTVTPNHDIEISGSNLRSVFYGISHFCESFLHANCAADADEEEGISDQIKIPCSYHYAEKARFQRRTLRTESDFDVWFVDWIAKNRFNAIAADSVRWDGAEAADVFAAAEIRGIDCICTGHNFYYFLSAEKYFKEYPEWFPLVEGNRVPTRSTGDNFCYSNRNAVTACAEEVIAFCRRNPLIKMVEIWPGDGGKICRCPECRKLSFAENYGNAMQQIASQVQRVLPGVVIGQMIYNFNDRNRSCVEELQATCNNNLPVSFAFWGQNLFLPWSENNDPAHRTVLSCVRKMAESKRNSLSIFCYHTDTYMNSNFSPIYGESLTDDFELFHSLGIDSLCLLWIPWNSPDSSFNMRRIALKNALLWGRSAMDSNFDVLRRTADFFEENQETMFAFFAILGELQYLTLAFAPRRFSDAWGCGFNRNVLKWSPEDPQDASVLLRRTLFQRAVEKLKEIHFAGSPLLREYKLHCIRRIQGLSEIFAAQAAIHEKDWREAVVHLEDALKSDMSDERIVTENWLTYCKERYLHEQMQNNKSHV